MQLGLDLKVLSTIAVVFILYYVSTQVLVAPVKPMPYSDFKQQVIADRVLAVVLRGDHVQGTLRESDAQGKALGFHTVVPALEDSRLLDLLAEHHVRIEVQATESPWWLQLLAGFLPWLLLIGLFVYSSRVVRERMGSGMGGGVFGFGQSRARRFEGNKGGEGFADVAGLESAKADLQEIIDYLKHPERFQKLGAKMPRGILLMGPPGTGKTLLAKATATEAGVPFFSVSGSEFIEMYVGVGASRVRDMFAKARAEAPSLIFVDEIDSVGRVRGTGLGGGNDEREQTLNQILAEMDGFEPNEPIVVMAATNRPDVLDPALLRPGRFDRKVTLELPQKAARRQLLLVHTRKTPLAQDVDLDEMAATTVGFSGADISNLVNEASLLAARHRRDMVCRDDFQRARDKIILGAPRDDLLNPSERERVACHEAGHALTAFFAKNSDPVEKVSIVPRGRALGMTEQRPLEDRHNIDEAYLNERLCILLGGRCAEKLRYGTVSTGAADDLKQATTLARKMVAQWGMSDNLGPVGYRIGEEHPFLGRELTEPKDFSEHTAELMDEEVRYLLRKAEQQTLALLKAQRPGLDAMVAYLLEHESMDHDELNRLLTPVQ